MTEENNVLDFSISYRYKTEEEIETIETTFYEFLEPHGVEPNTTFSNVGASGELYTDNCLDIEKFKRALEQWKRRHS